MHYDKKIALILSVIHLVAGASLLLLSGWFISASALAGLASVVIGFNYIIPAASIRMLALVRIVSGYGEKYFAHAEVLNRVGRLRLYLYDSVFSKAPTKSRAENLERLDRDSELIAGKIASVWMPVISSIALVCYLFAMAISLYSSIVSVLIAAALLVASLCYIQYRQCKKQQSEVNIHQMLFRKAIEFDLGSATLWRGGFPTKNREIARQWRVTTSRSRTLQAQGDRRLFALAGILIVAVSCFPPQDKLGNPLIVLVLFLCLTIPDWFGPAVRAMLPLAQTNIAERYLAIRNRSNNEGHGPKQVGRSCSIENLQLVDVAPNRPGLVSNTISFRINRSQVALIQGSSGSGKSSLLLAITGFLEHKGTILINGNNISGVSAAQRRSDLLYVEQFPLVLSDTLRRNLNIANQNASDKQLVDTLNDVGLTNLASEPLDQWVGEAGRELSGGEKKRLGMARALLSNAPVWLLDEPFEGLDSDAAYELMALINKKREQRIILIASHLPLENMKVDQIINLDKNR